MFVFIYIVGVLGTFLLTTGGLTYLVVALADRRPFPFRAVAGTLGGFIAGALFVWNLAPSDWTLPLSTTLAASVNAAKYGHAVEHAAEGIVIWMLFAAVTGAAIGGFGARIARRSLTGAARP
jgi:hypothetical protein